MYTDYLKAFIQLISECEIDYCGKRRMDWEDAFEGVVMCFEETRRDRCKAFFIGNGGSAGIASHMATDFLKNGSLKTINLHDSSLLTCMANDYGYENVFSEPLQALAEENDLLVAISSSGNSANIVNAVIAAKECGMKVMTFSGFAPDNRIRALGDWNVYVPMKHYGMVETMHMLFLQQIVDEMYTRSNIV